MPSNPKTKKKPSHKNTSAKKIPVKKVTRKRTSRKRKKQNGTLKKNLLVILAAFLMISLVSFGYFLGQNEVETAATLTSVKEKKKVLPRKEKYIKKEMHVKKVKHKTATPKKLKKKRVVAVKNAKGLPKLVIIIDDVSQANQLRLMKETGLKLTPAIFPPSELSMTSHTLARGLKHAMIHLPMESGSKQFNTQYKTLFRSYTEQQIEQRVKELRKLFPKVRYLNNHTGSVFTDDYAAMYSLYEALRNEGFTFVDSRTIGSSKVALIASEFGDRYISRDIFIDNVHTVEAIHAQLRKAVLLAKKRGFAIAIGHPHTVTMQALASSTDILKEVNLVYIDTLFP